MASTKPAKPGPRPAATSTIHTIKVTLADIQPEIWRRLQVPSATTLTVLHQIIQDAFGWENYHMWEFTAAKSKTLAQVALYEGNLLGYTYDFGDSWEHRILVEAVASPEPGIAYPRCLDGQRACPPEDCGGIWGYDDLLQILADPTHDEHEERLEWLGLDSADQFDPAAFDLAKVNTALSRRATVLIKA